MQNNPNSDDNVELEADEWGKQFKRIVDGFLDDWKVGYVEDPKEWPMVLPASIWMEQFLAYYNRCNEDHDD